ncbi:MAG: T9SS type A sorting domain-containing protein [Bacteroidetes bacterium]|nr:T9SS type A sorting domain-containing protein [Bacteroidota bacterium]
MRKLFTLSLLVAMAGFTVSVAQVNGLKGNGEVFFSETFDWANPADEKGWTAPEGFYMVDHDDNGFNWHWWPNDSLKAEWTFEPPFQSLTREDGHLCLFANQYNNFVPLGELVPVNNSVVFPTLDCSQRSSVVVRYLTNFMGYSGGWSMSLEVSNDAGVHWAAFDADFNCGHKDRPNDIAPGESTLFQANISEVAAGMSEVVVRLTWTGTGMYFWLVDDFEVLEAWDNDLQMQHFSLGWDDGDENTLESTSYQMPKSQLGGSFYNWQSSVLNFGEFEQNDMFLEVDITKNSQSIFNISSEATWLNPLWIDTVNLEEAFTPEEYGHYGIKFKWNQAEEENAPDDNEQTIFFHVTDSVYSRSDDTPELAWAYGFERYRDGFGEDFWNMDHFVGSIFPIYADCEVDGVSVYIMGGLADDSIDFRYTLFWLPPEDEDPEGVGAIEWLTTESLVLDSSMFNTWIYLPFDKDGESEFLLEGDIVYAGIQYNNFHYSKWDRRNNNLTIGVDMTTGYEDARSIGLDEEGWYTGTFMSDRNPLIKMYLNDHGNVIDNVDQALALTSLDQNYPNPFNRSTEISYELAQSQDISIEICDMTGRKIMLIEEGKKLAGRHAYTLKAEDFEAGIYFYTLKAGQFTETRRMIISK